MAAMAPTTSAAATTNIGLCANRLGDFDKALASGAIAKLSDEVVAVRVLLQAHDDRGQRLVQALDRGRQDAHRE